MNLSDFLRKLLFARGPRRGAAITNNAAIAAPQNDTSAAFQRLNAELPLKDAATRQAFVRREALLNLSGKISGYEFSLLTSLQARLQKGGPETARAYDAALVARLANSEVDALLGPRLAVIRLSAPSASASFIEQLPKANTVLIFEPTLVGDDDADNLAVDFARLKRLGFAVGLRLNRCSDIHSPRLAQADYIQITVSDFDGIELRDMTRHLKAHPGDKVRMPRLIAHAVQTQDDFQFCLKCGFSLFQGPFVSSRESLKTGHEASNRLAVLPILNMIRSERSNTEIAQQLKQAPTLSYKLLRYLNSAAIGLQQPIESLTQALTLLGRDKLYRWTSLLMFDFANPGFGENILSEHALTRGRTLELLAGQGNLPKSPDQLFLIGIFSLLDLALGRPLPELIEKAALPEMVRDALLAQAGICTVALAMIVLNEADHQTDAEQLASALVDCGLSDQQLADASTAALRWAHEMLAQTA